ncbi:g1635 [Coccomyxa elongata]
MSVSACIYDPSKNRQVYITAVTKHYYSCWLATLAPAAQTGAPLSVTVSLLLAMLRTQVSLLASVGVPVECIQCGLPERIEASQRRAQEVKVCRGCWLVRYCTGKCQAAAWHQHKAHCTKYAKMRR